MINLIRWCIAPNDCGGSCFVMQYLVSLYGEKSWLLFFNCLNVLWLWVYCDFLAVPLVGLQCVIVVFSEYTHLLLTLKTPPIICSRRQLQILPLFQKWQIRHDISWESSAGRRFSCNIIPHFFRKLGKMSQNLSSAAGVIGALRVKVSRTKRW